MNGDTAVAGEAERALAESAETMMSGSITVPMASGLTRHAVHPVQPLDGIGEARIILDIGGDGELAAGLEPRDKAQLSMARAAVDRGRIALQGQRR